MKNVLTRALLPLAISVTLMTGCTPETIGALNTAVTGASQNISGATSSPQTLGTESGAAEGAEGLEAEDGEDDDADEMDGEDDDADEMDGEEGEEDDADEMDDEEDDDAEADGAGEGTEVENGADAPPAAQPAA